MKHTSIVISAIFGSVLLMSSIIFYSVQGSPQAAFAGSIYSLRDHSITAPISFTFSRPIDRKNLRIEVSPKVEGEIFFSNPLFGNHLYTRAQFVPHEKLQPGTDYRIIISDIENRLTGQRAPNTQLLLQTEKPSRIVAIQSTSDELSADTLPQLQVTLDKPNQFLDIYFETEPAVDWNLSIDESKTQYTLTAKKPLHFDTSYTVDVYGSTQVTNGSKNIVFQGRRTLLSSYDFHTRDSHTVRSLSPDDSFVPIETPIIVDLGYPINIAALNTDAPIRVEPTTTGTIEWQSENSVVQFIPENGWRENTSYVVSLNENFCEETDDCTFSFTTAGPVEVVSSFPQVGMSGVDIESAITLNFNQTVDADSAAENFSITPHVTGEFILDHNSLTFEPLLPLSFGTTYTVTLSDGMLGQNNYELQKPYTFSFSTQNDSILLPVALDYQDRPLSCEAAVLKMGLDYFGIRVTETDIMKIVGYDPTTRQGNIWGDPHVAYVGDIDGEQNTTGYGVYWEPIARAAQYWRPNSYYFTNWELSQVLTEIQNGHPVLMWGVYPGGTPDSWQTPSGKMINAWKGEHTRIIIGFTGTIQKPDSIIVLDPFAGKQIYSPKELVSNWSAFNMSGVVIQ